MNWLLLLMASTSAAWAGDCPDPASLGTDAAAAESRLAEAEALYPVIYEQVAELPELAPWVIDGVSCLREPASPQLAARYHRFRALNTDPLGGLGDAVRTQARASLGAAWRLDPEHVSTLPGDHGHRTAITGEPTSEAAPTPEVGALFFDGAETTDRPTASATFFQRTDASGAVVDSAYLYPGQALPAYPVLAVTVAPEPVESPVSAPVEPAPHRSPKKALRITGVALGAAALGLFAGNVASYNAALASDRDTATNAMPTVNALGYGAWATGAGAAALITTSFAVK
ncbi:MAG: hypothetical protein EP330_23285 [Deltaproteobacteria bacterium]|nr:MAG: hypothetical protein EP330_23285 [Deltaproteobacteria bacterium]